ncbi:hypothetical protein [Gordonia rubripertincta]|uniref:Uncharacterized protein n=1 Tax=Gordonia rubripertincta TaxID=36822 RepID=A0ABT4MW02_GORRU|nr:hypothetical protein [Gordonia rubripertincta]MCZ4551190.1 hypothetical protein [Gordonia rubripertincta]
MSAAPPPTRPRPSRRRIIMLLSAVVGIAIIIALTATIAALTVPDEGSDNDRTVAAPVITDQQATDVATALTRSMFEITPATADAQIAAFKANTCGDLAKDGLPNLVSFTDELKSQDRSAAVTFQSVAVVPHPPQAPVVQAIVASTWQSGDAVNKTRVVYDLIVQNGKTCVTRAQFL